MYQHDRWLKLYARDGRALHSACSGSEPERIWKIRLDPDGIHDFGSHFSSAELDVVDRVLDRALHGRSVVKLATQEAREHLANVLGGRRWAGLFIGSRVTRGAVRSDVVVSTDELALRLTLARRRGRFYLVDAAGVPSPSDPPLTGGNTATSSPSASR
jgi:hypothetical protein